MRMQFVPFPAMKPRQPSSRHIFARALGTDILYSVLPALWTWNNIFNRSSGDTTVLETAPATPPAQNEAKTGCPRISRMKSRRDGGGGAAMMEICFHASVQPSQNTPLDDLLG